MNYEQWEQTVPLQIRNDSLWKLTVYRLALFLSDLCWNDVTKLMKDRRTIGLSDQLYRAVGSVCGNIEEGYSRGTGKDRARFYEYALGSARESRGWYYRGRKILTDAVVQHRLNLLSQIIRLLLTIIPQQRTYKIKDVSLPFGVKFDDETMSDDNELEKLLEDVPV